MTLPNTSVFNFYEGTDPQHYTDLTGVNLNAAAKALLANDVILTAGVNAVEARATSLEVNGATKLASGFMYTKNMYTNNLFYRVSDEAPSTAGWTNSGAGILAFVVHPYTKGFSCPYIPNTTIPAGYTADKRLADVSTPFYQGVYSTKPPIYGYDETKLNSGLSSGWQNVKGNILKLTFDGRDDTSTKTFFPTGDDTNWETQFVKSNAMIVEFSCFAFFEFGEIRIGSHAGYYGTNKDSRTGTVYGESTGLANGEWHYIKNRFTLNPGTWRRNYLEGGIAFTNTVPTEVYIAVPQLRIISTMDTEDNGIINMTPNTNA